MAGLRKALGGARDLIKTVPGRGYIFTGRCGEAHRDEAPSAFQPAAPARGLAALEAETVDHSPTPSSARLYLFPAEAAGGAHFEEAEAPGRAPPPQSCSSVSLAKIMSQMMTQRAAANAAEPAGAQSVEAAPSPAVFLPALIVLCSEFEATGDPSAERAIVGALNVAELISALADSSH
jgi:hypothetical protein